MRAAAAENARMAGRRMAVQALSAIMLVVVARNVAFWQPLSDAFVMVALNGSDWLPPPATVTGNPVAAKDTPVELQTPIPAAVTTGGPKVTAVIRTAKGLGLVMVIDPATVAEAVRETP